MLTKNKICDIINIEGGKSMIGIYMFEHKITHKKYIGQSIHITRRKWEHLTTPSPCSKIDGALLAERDNFDFKILEECPVE